MYIYVQDYCIYEYNFTELYEYTSQSFLILFFSFQLCWNETMQ